MCAASRRRGGLSQVHPETRGRRQRCEADRLGRAGAVTPRYCTKRPRGYLDAPLRHSDDSLFSLLRACLVAVALASATAPCPPVEATGRALSSRRPRGSREPAPGLLSADATGDAASSRRGACAPAKRRSLRRRPRSTPSIRDHASEDDPPFNAGARRPRRRRHRPHDALSWRASAAGRLAGRHVRHPSRSRVADGGVAHVLPPDGPRRSPASRGLESSTRRFITLRALRTL